MGTLSMQTLKPEQRRMDQLEAQSQTGNANFGIGCVGSPPIGCRRPFGTVIDELGGYAGNDFQRSPFPPTPRLNFQTAGISLGSADFFAIGGFFGAGGFLGAAALLEAGGFAGARFLGAARFASAATAALMKKVTSTQTNQ